MLVWVLVSCLTGRCAWWGWWHEQKVPMCPSCDSVIKPDITFFGEKLPDLFDRSLKQDRLECDLVIVMGSSLKVHTHPMVCDV